METSLSYIDTYFTGQPSAAMKAEFEKRITDDPGFAEEVAFYLSVKREAAASPGKEHTDRFKEIYTQYKNDKAEKPVTRRLVHRLWPYIAAAAILAAIIVGWAVFLRPASPEQLADGYIRENLQTLGVTMGSKEDSLQTGLRLYNEGNLEQALVQFEAITKNDTSSSEAKKYAGIVALRLQQYEKASGYFSRLGNDPQLYANPGKFYHALTLLKRNLPADKQQAKQILQQVVALDLEGKKTAQEWLSKL